MELAIWTESVLIASVLLLFVCSIGYGLAWCLGWYRLQRELRKLCKMKASQWEWGGADIDRHFGAMLRRTPELMAGHTRISQLLGLVQSADDHYYVMTTPQRREEFLEFIQAGVERFVEVANERDWTATEKATHARLIGPVTPSRPREQIVATIGNVRISARSPELFARVAQGLLQKSSCPSCAGREELIQMLVGYIRRDELPPDIAASLARKVEAYLEDVPLNPYP